jgi:hypothetical protein
MREPALKEGLFPIELGGVLMRSRSGRIRRLAARTEGTRHRLARPAWFSFVFHDALGVLHVTCPVSPDGLGSQFAGVVDSTRLVISCA